MKSHEQKMHEKAEHEAELERNDLMAWGTRSWNNFKEMKTKDILTSTYFLGAIAIGAVCGLLYWIFSGSAGDAARWREFEKRETTESVEQFIKENASTLPGKAAEMQRARQLLGPRGLTLMANNLDANVRANAIKSVEEARTIFTKLIDEFKGDMTLQCEAIEGAAQAELALVGIPKEGSSDASRDFRGSVDKAIELYRRYEKTAGPVAGGHAKKMAEELEARKNDVVRLNQYINEKLSPNRPQPKIDVPPSLTPAPAGPTPPPK